MNEKPVERLNYFNGQRLQASDFKLEQDYHIRVRRWLNRSLYTPGIASGLEVYKIEGSLKVKVMPGLAIDNLGREIILLEEQDFPVMGHGGGNGNGACKGPYLTIRYQEDVIAQEDGCCAIGGDSGSKAAWGGPARILAEPMLELNAELPHESSGKIALACLTLAKGCTSVERVDAGVRRYIGEASAASVKQYALEGVRTVDARNPGRIYFHIRGRQPSSVTLYLQSEKLPTLFYTELGNHAHSAGVNGNLNIPAHSHGGADASSGTTENATTHSHTVGSVKANVDADVWKRVFDKVAAAATADGLLLMAGALEVANLVEWVAGQIDPDNVYMDLTLSPFIVHHRPGDKYYQRELLADAGAMAVQMSITLNEEAEPRHTHPIAQHPADGKNWVIPFAGAGTAAAAGVNDVDAPNYRARTGDPLKYVDDLRIAIDGNDVTEAARMQVAWNRTSEDWTKFGALNDETHSFVKNGTGPIRIDFLPGVVLDQDRPHYIDLSVVGEGNGGQIHFNLYVE